MIRNGKEIAHKSSSARLRGAKSTGFILASNLPLGLNFHFLNAVHANAINSTADATAMMMMNVVFGSPPILLVEVVLSAAAEADADARADETDEMWVVEGVAMICNTVDIPGVDKMTGAIDIAEGVGMVLTTALVALAGVSSRSALGCTSCEPSVELVGIVASDVAVDVCSMNNVVLVLVILMTDDVSNDVAGTTEVVVAEADSAAAASCAEIDARVSLFMGPPANSLLLTTRAWCLRDGGTAG